MEESNTFRSSLDAVARAYGMEDIDRHGSDQDVYQRVADVAKRSEEGRGFAGGRRRGRPHGSKDTKRRKRRTKAQVRAARSKLLQGGAAISKEDVSPHLEDVQTYFKRRISRDMKLASIPTCQVRCGTLAKEATICKTVHGACSEVAATRLVVGTTQGNDGARFLKRWMTIPAENQRCCFVCKDHYQIMLEAGMDRLINIGAVRVSTIGLESLQESQTVADNSLTRFAIFGPNDPSHDRGSVDLSRFSTVKPKLNARGFAIMVRAPKIDDLDAYNEQKQKLVDTGKSYLSSTVGLTTAVIQGMSGFKEATLDALDRIERGLQQGDDMTTEMDLLADFGASSAVE